MSGLGHVAISASAGSGKTFQLAHRYIRIMAHGVPADRIIALTFSRKAAGEIFDSVVEHLTAAASSDEKAREAAGRIERPETTRADFRRLLRDLLNGLHRAHISTLDSFSIGIVRAFPMELGISVDFDIMDTDGEAARIAREEVLSHIFDPRGHSDAKAQSAFREAFKLATFGREEKGLAPLLHRFLSSYERHYHIQPEEEAWGRKARIWPSGSPWLQPVKKVWEAGERVSEKVAGLGLPDKVAQRWQDFVEAAVTHEPGNPWPRAIEYMMEKLLPVLEQLMLGRAEVKLGHTRCDMQGDLCRALLDLVRHVMHVEIRTALEQTRGLHRILAQYETCYDQGVRRRGRLTFDDAQFLLTSGNRFSGGRVISRDDEAESRLYIDYRLDSRLDHWLLDEFQDTSDLQWDVLKDLADEILQDTGGARSFFYVGDVKQAIYGWRGGNARLFGRILDRYGSALDVRPLSTSFRSCTPVIDTVNRVFGELDVDGLPKQAVDRWNDDWHTHAADERVAGLPGQVMLLEREQEAGAAKPDPEDRYLAVARILKTIDPLARGLSVACLVRQNKDGAALVDVLRRACPEMPVAHEGRAAIKDSVVVALMLSLVRYAEHPGDTFAWRHLQMSPLRHCFKRDRLSPLRLPLDLLRRIQATGFQEFIRYWGRRLNDEVPLDAFGRKRLQDLADAAGTFDASGRRDVNAFLRFIDHYELHELAADDAIRVMTIHQAKGLGFDVVFLPDLQGRGISSAGALEFAAAGNEGGSRPDWMLKMPRRLVAEHDDVLSVLVSKADEEACRDALCLLYVAMTRAKRALYMVTSFPGKTSKVLDAAALVKHRLCGDPKAITGDTVSWDGHDYTALQRTGQDDWYLSVEPRPAGRPPEGRAEATPMARRPALRTRLARATPSESAVEKEEASRLFGTALAESFALGTAVHELFEQFEWYTSSAVERAINAWRGVTTCREELQTAAIDAFTHALQSKDAQAALAKPSGTARLWREQSFEIVLDDEWVSGTFDRVTLLTDEAGVFLGATVLDFKTNDVRGDEAMAAAVGHYTPQMQLYARALSRLLEVAPENIACDLLFTRPGRVVRIVPS